MSDAATRVEPTPHRGASSVRDARGSILVEFAVAAALFFTVVFGIMEFGLLIFAYDIVSNSAREGVRWAAVRGSASGRAASTSDVQAYVSGRSLGRLRTSDVTVSWNPDNHPGSTVQVTASYSFQNLIPLLPTNTIAFSSTSTMLISR